MTVFVWLFAEKDFPAGRQINKALRNDIGLESGNTDWELGYGRAFFFIIAENNSVRRNVAGCGMSVCRIILFLLFLH